MDDLATMNQAMRDFCRNKHTANRIANHPALSGVRSALWVSIAATLYTFVRAAKESVNAFRYRPHDPDQKGQVHDGIK